MSAGFSTRTPQQALAALLDRYAPQQLLLIGAMVALGHADPEDPLQLVIGFFAVFLGAANAAGGYIVTERMLGMFKAGGRKEGGAK